MAICPAFDPAVAYVRGVIAFVDCNSTVLAEQGYRALGAGTRFATALDGLVIVAVAVVGYRMLLGGPFAIRQAVLVVLRIGLVLALALHWSAYQPLVYDLATRGPQELLSAVVPPTGLGADSADGLIDRVQGVDTLLGSVVHPEMEVPAGTGGAGSAAIDAAAQRSASGQTPELAPETRELLSSTDRLLVLGVLAATVAVRVIMAIMLALGPLFVASLLFASSRGLFVGWLRVLAGTAVAAFAVPVVVSLELALVEPQALLLRRLFIGSQALGSLPERLWITSVLFDLVLLAALVAVARSAAAIRLPESLRRDVMTMIETRMDRAAVPATGLAGWRPGTPQPRDHAQAIADAAFATERRDRQAIGDYQGVRTLAPREAPSRSPDVQAEPYRIGQMGRVLGHRQTATASRRDHTK